MIRRLAAHALTEDWKLCWRWLSVQLATGLIILDALGQEFESIRQFLPAHWVRYAGIAIIVGRVLRQRPRQPKEQS